MKLSWDEVKRQSTLDERGLDFASAAGLFASDELTSEDVRFDYGERRFISFGFVHRRLCTIVWTPRGDGRHIISMRKANDREKSGFISKLDPADDAPELTEEWFARADLYRNGKLVRRGRPLGSGTKELVSLRLDKQALAAFKATGPGWQARINDTVVRSAKRLGVK